jgi:hypothetical protein
MFLTKVTSAAVLLLTVCVLAGGVFLSADPAAATGQTTAEQKEPPKSLEGLPNDAGKRIQQFEAEAEAIRKKADAEIKARHEKLIADLEHLKKEYTKSGDLDGAVAIRDRIRELKEKPEPAKAPAKQASKWAGEWLFDGKEDQLCAICQQGRVLLLVNERGEMVTGKIMGENKLTWGWGENALVGELKDEGKTISWGNDTTWKRP